MPNYLALTPGGAAKPFTADDKADATEVVAHAYPRGTRLFGEIELEVPDGVAQIAPPGIWAAVALATGHVSPKGHKVEGPSEGPNI